MAFPVQTLSQLRPILVGFRKSAGFTQAQLAARLGVTQQSYAQLEANPSAVSIDRLFKVLNVLGVRLTLDPGTPDAASPPDTAPVPVPKRVAAARRRAAALPDTPDTPARAPAAAKAPSAAARKRAAAAAPGKRRDTNREDW